MALPVTPWKLREAARCVRAGGLIAYPTEAVYGLGCDPLNEAAMTALLELKQRPAVKGVILIASDFDQLRPYVKPLSEERMKPVLASWPGPNTWLLPAADGLPGWLTGSHPTLAVRVTGHPVAAALCRACDSPLVSTSANRSGQQPARSPLQVRLKLRSGVDCIVHAPLGGNPTPSTIRDALSGEVIRG
ncbi:MAG: L-threonylcarbamoyladenylate synthase [Sedimenticola sp.]|nr:L-threonylcarbamoyladenylate synthase [Sedimenticola sp.]